MDDPDAETARYFFDLTNGTDTIPDPDGLDLPDLKAAIMQAHLAIAELQQEDPAFGREWHGWRLEIVDQARDVVWSLSLDGSAPGHPLH